MIFCMNTNKGEKRIKTFKIHTHPEENCSWSCVNARDSTRCWRSCYSGNSTAFEEVQFFVGIFPNVSFLKTIFSPSGVLKKKMEPILILIRPFFGNMGSNSYSNSFKTPKCDSDSDNFHYELIQSSRSTFTLSSRIGRSCAC